VARRSDDIMDAQKPLYGLLAEFPTPTSLVLAARRTHEDGYRRFDAFSPYPMHELFEVMDIHDKKLQLCVLGAGILGAFAGFGLCYWTQAIAYPLNIGGRPFNSWPSFIPVTFEVTILFAAFTAVIAMIVMNGLPMPYHPVFNVKRFRDHASQDGMFLAIESEDPRFDRERTRAFLLDLGATEVNDVEP
jgi:hypothetical protein